MLGCPRCFAGLYRLKSLLGCFWLLRSFGGGKLKVGVLVLKSFRSTVQTRRWLGESLYQHGQSSKSRKIVGFWLLGCAGLTYGGVALGGLTRYVHVICVECHWFIRVDSLQINGIRIIHGKLGSFSYNEAAIEWRWLVARIRKLQGLSGI